jgi:G3E family GTPase
MQNKLQLDGIVTVVDAKHIWQHIDDSDEAKEQIAFADVILLNKTDLVPPAELEKLEGRIKNMNAAAKIYHTQNALIDMDKVLDVGGFNLSRALEVDPKFMEPEYPFEWGGIFKLSTGEYSFVMQEGPDPAMNMSVFACENAEPNTLAEVQEEAVIVFSDFEKPLKIGETLATGKHLYQLELTESAMLFKINIPSDGYYAFFTEHHPNEFEAILKKDDLILEPLISHEYKPDHEHDEEVTSVGINVPGDLDVKKLNAWLGELLRTKGTDIFRMKGVLSIKDEPNRFVFQGVHMLFDGRPDKPWDNTPRHNSLIFIGRNLDRAQLNEDFRRCLA